jgi:sugar/nucleoside kinase (ribokinase family)
MKSTITDKKIKPFLPLNYFLISLGILSSLVVCTNHIRSFFMITIKPSAEFDVIGIGSPLVDFIIDADDALLHELSLTKGGMKLIDENESRSIRALVGKRVTDKVPGGSAANTLSALAILGGKAAFIGSIGDDEDGKFYLKESERSGVRGFLTKHDALTGHALTFITPGGERSFATHLGAAIRLTSDDIDVNVISRSKVLHLEGYLFESPIQREAAVKGMRAAKDAGVLVSIDAADPGVVMRNRETLVSIAAEFADVIFLNEEEAAAFTGKNGEDAARDVAKSVSIAVVKLGAKGSVIATKDSVSHAHGFSAKVVNTNGAGDVYAGGFLYGLTRGLALEKCGLIGSFAAARVVEENGARLSKRPDVEGIL